MVEVKGRPQRDWIVSLVPQDGSLLIRLDDDKHAPFWMEIRIPETELLRLTGLVHRKTHAKGIQLDQVAELPEADELPELPEADATPAG